MLKRISIFLCLSLVLIVATFSTQALPTNELTVLAKYAPARAVAFGAMRIDEPYLQTLDATLEKLSQSVNGLPTGLTNIVKEAAQTFGGYDKVKEWLGATASVILVSPSDVPIFALELADADKAEAALDEVLNAETLYEKTRVDEGWLYKAPDEYTATLLLTQDALLIKPVDYDGTGFAVLKGENTLDSADFFQNAINGLPNDDYNIVGFINARVFAEQNLPTNGDNPIQNQLAQYARGLGGTAIGLVVLDERNFAIDFAQVVSDPSAVQQIAPLFNREPVNLDFAENIPADAQLVIQGTNLGALQAFAFDSLKNLGEYADSLYEKGDLPSQDQGALFIDDAVTFVELSFKGMAGQSLADAFGWMSGDFALYSRAGLAVGNIAVDVNLSVANTDSAEATAFVDGIAQLLDDTNIPYQRRDDELSVSAISELVAMAATSPIPLAERNLDFILGANENLLTFGTFPVTKAVLEADFKKLSDVPEFQNAVAWVLPNANTVLYVNTVSLAQLVAIASPNENPLRAFESASGSLSNSENKVVARLVLTLAK